MKEKEKARYFPEGQIPPGTKLNRREQAIYNPSPAQQQSRAAAVERARFASDCPICGRPILGKGLVTCNRRTCIEAAWEKGLIKRNK